MFNELIINTIKRDQFIDITNDIQKIIIDKNIISGLCTVFIPHTTAGIIINENADPTVVDDMIKFLNDNIPWINNYKHAEGNSAAHIKASYFGSLVNVIIEKGKLQLGIWQSIYFAEFDGPRKRKIYIKFL